jgi:hypothetical protein
MEARLADHGAEELLDLASQFKERTEVIVCGRYDSYHFILASICPQAGLQQLMAAAPLIERLGQSI